VEHAAAPRRAEGQPGLANASTAAPRAPAAVVRAMEVEITSMAMAAPPRHWRSERSCRVACCSRCSYRLRQAPSRVASIVARATTSNRAIRGGSRPSIPCGWHCPRWATPGMLGMFSDRGRRQSVRGRRQNPSPTSTGTEPLRDRPDTEGGLRALELLRLTDPLMFTEECSSGSAKSCRCRTGGLRLGGAGQQPRHDSPVTIAATGELMFLNCFRRKGGSLFFGLSTLPG
jgi:hypothetical protein